MRGQKRGPVRKEHGQESKGQCKNEQNDYPKKLTHLRKTIRLPVSQLWSSLGHQAPALLSAPDEEYLNICSKYCQ